MGLWKSHNSVVLQWIICVSYDAPEDILISYKTFQENEGFDSRSFTQTLTMDAITL